MDFSYVIILAVVLIVSPFVLKIASKQDKKTKQHLRFVFILMLSAQIILGFLSGLPLGVFPAITALQMILLILNRKFYTLAVILNFINTVVFFYSMIRLGQTTGIQDTSFASITIAFILLFGNIIGLIFINQDKNLLKKYSR